MANYFTLLTPTGLAKVTNAQLTESKVEIARIAIGDSNGINYKPTGTETRLKNEKWRGAVASTAVDTNNPNWIIVEAVIPASVGGFTLREVALYDVAGDIIAIGNYPDTYKPVEADGSTMDLVLRTIIEVSNASTVTLKVDPNVIIASRKYVDDKVASAVGSTSQVVTELQTTVTTHTATDATTTQKGHVKLSSSTSSTSETEAATPKAVKTVNDELTTHLAEKATETGYGHIRLSDIPKPTKQSIGLENVDNVKQIPLSEKGAPNGVALLDGNGKIPIENLGGFTIEKIGGFVLTSDTPSIQIDNIPQSYTHLKILLELQSTDTGWTTARGCIVNNFTNSIYYKIRETTALTSMAVMSNSKSSSTNSRAINEIFIPNYSKRDTHYVIMNHYHRPTPVNAGDFSEGVWWINNLSPITIISLPVEGSYVYKAGSAVTLYGIK